MKRNDETGINMNSSIVEPGSRIKTTCRGCHKPILKILTINRRWGPFDPVPVKPDGKRMLIFPDGRTGRYHERFELGHESHFATCPNADQFKRKKR